MCSYIHPVGGIQAIREWKQVNLVTLNGTAGESVKFPEAISTEMRLRRAKYFGYANFTEEQMKMSSAAASCWFGRSTALWLRQRSHTMLSATSALM